MTSRWLAAVALACSLVACHPAKASPGATGEAAPMQTDTTWKDVDRLLSEHKLSEAEPKVDALLAAALKSKDEAGWTKALVQATRIRVGLGGYETAVRFLKGQPWPTSALGRVTCDLFYAETLTTYLARYGYEIRQREPVAGGTATADLKAWTADQVYEEALKSYQDAWSQRDELGHEPLGRLAGYLEPNNYPEGIRSTLRDAVTYLAVDLLADQSYWSAADVNGLYRLDFPALLGGAEGGEDPSLADRAKPPLVRAMAALGDLEAWHAGEGHPEAALEARLERLRRLHTAFPGADKREAIRSHLDELLAGLRRKPWWSMGMAELADFDRDAGRLVRAHEEAKRGADAFPESPGGLRCRSLERGLAAPDFQLTAMASDAAGKRSLEVRHKNLPHLYFRAYRFDLLKHVEGSRNYDILPGEADWHAVAGRKPDAAWDVELPATPDFSFHQTFVTPPLTANGLYLIVASARADFSEDHNRLSSVSLVLGDLALLTRTEAGALSVTAVSGQSGQPIPGATVYLYRFDYGKGHHVQEKAVTDKAGAVRLAVKPADDGAFFVVATKGAQVAIDPQYQYVGRAAPEKERQASFLYTDRAAYRPGQKLLWKVVAYHGHAGGADLRVASGADVTLTLVDANGHTVGTQKAKTNDFGSAAGEFTLPEGRMLGHWQVRSSYGPSQTSVRVEEYKRPTFEVTFDDDQAPLRLNRQAMLKGKATYHFGMPVTHGQLTWRVTREPLLPPWWGWLGLGDVFFGESETRRQVVAAGVSALDEKGGFTVSFLPAADEAPKGVTYRYVVTADLTDEGGETRSATHAVRLGAVAVEAAIEPAAGFLTAGRPEEVVIRRTSLDGTPRPGKGRWHLAALAQPQAAVPPADLPLPKEALPKTDPDAPVVTAGDKLRPRWFPGYTVDGTLAEWKEAKESASGELAHDAKGVAKLTLPALSPGVYRLRYETVDDFGAKAVTTKDLIVAGPGLHLALPAVLAAEAPEVKAGGTVRLLAHSGLPGQTALLDLVHADGRHERRLLTGKSSPVVDVPLTAADRGGLGVTLTVVTDHQAVVLHRTVRVPWDDKKLDVSFSSFRDKLRPGAKETWTIHVKGPNATHATAEVLAFMYDRSLDLFAKAEVPSPLAAFPSRADVAWLRSNLGPVGGRIVAGRGFEQGIPVPPMLTGDRLKFLDGLPIPGGPGHGLRMMRSAGLMMEDAAPAAAPMQAAAMAKSADAEAAKAEAPAEPAGPAVRSDFAETAFFRPQLLTDAKGDVSVTFTVPDSLTSWNVWAVALTRDLASGLAHTEARSMKELMVRPYVPRFLREGDAAELPVVVDNGSGRELAGDVVVEILDAGTSDVVSPAFSLTPTRQAFHLAAGGSTTLRFALKAPTGVRPVAFRVTATAGDLADGELRPVPVLPSRLHLSQSRFASLQGGAARTLEFQDLARGGDQSRTTDALTVRVDGDLFGSVLAALPYLVHYPYDCVEQVMNRYLAAGLARKLEEHDPAIQHLAKQLSSRPTREGRWDAKDPVRRMALEETPWLAEAEGGGALPAGASVADVLDPRSAAAERDTALAKLKLAQAPDGSFPWFPGGPPSPYMTIYLMHGFARAADAGLPVPKEVVAKAWRYLLGYYRKDIAPHLGEKNVSWVLPTFLNYVASSFPEALTPEIRKTLLEGSLAHWKELPPLVKSYLALTLHRAGRAADAKLVFDSVMDQAKTDKDLGTYWAPEDRAWLWYNDTVESHAFALRTLLELEPHSPKVDGLALWLFLDKRLNHWKSTKATAEAALALVKYLEEKKQLHVPQAVTVTVGGEAKEFRFDPKKPEPRPELTLHGAEVTPAAAKITVTPKTQGLLLATATWQFATDQLPKEASGDFFTVHRRYFRRRPGTAANPDVTLEPLAPGAALAPGDEVEVQLSLTAKHEAEYVHLRDPRGAGFEPGSQVSAWHVGTGLAYYEQVRDSGEDFFFERLPVGEYTFHYRVRASMGGTFRVGPATVQPLYAPEFVAYSAGDTLSVK